jgi:hypothetical protein
MGFNSTASTITVTARLTSKGRERLLKESSSILSHFIIGDSDANYQTNQTLATGYIPSTSGNRDENGGLTNINIASGIEIKSKVKLAGTQAYLKPVEAGSYQVRAETVSLGETSATTTNLLFTTLNRTVNLNTTNYFKTLSLPITTTEKNFFNLNSNSAGWLDTAFSGFNTDNVLLGVIDNDSYGELIDGKSIKLTLPVYTATTVSGVSTGLTTYEIYSTFVNTTQYNKSQQDNRYTDGYVNTTSLFGSNVAYLVSDNVQKPNNDSTKSWSTGFDTFKPFEVNSKSLINFKNNTTVTPPIVADKIIGVIYLEKGMFAITDPTIVSGIATDLFDVSGNVTTTLTSNATTPSGFWYYTGDTYHVEIDSIKNNFVQNLVCIANRNEFYESNNTTFTTGDSVRITEIGITDITGQLLAVGKIDRQVIKAINDFVIFDVQIVV